VRIGIFGGSFDPVHVGHLLVAEACAETLSLDEVRFVPAWEQPFKGGRHHASATHRVAMLELALRGNPRFVLDLCEVERQGVSYTIDTLVCLQKRFPDDQLFLLIGADAARDLSSWRDAARLPTLANIVVLSRPGVPLPQQPLVTHNIEVPAIDVSATAIRQAIGEGRSIRYQVTTEVHDYLVAHRLYT
jgi:nicotinate-nucleotide adenylyltransferase